MRVEAVQPCRVEAAEPRVAVQPNPVWLNPVCCLGPVLQLCLVLPCSMLCFLSVAMHSPCLT